MIYLNTSITINMLSYPRNGGSSRAGAILWVYNTYNL